MAMNHSLRDALKEAGDILNDLARFIDRVDMRTMSAGTSDAAVGDIVDKLRALAAEIEDCRPTNDNEDRPPRVSSLKKIK